MRIEVPAQRKRRPPPKVQPAGTWRATIAGAKELDDDEFLIKWRFAALAKRWTIDQQVGGRELAEILVDVGLAGQVVEDLAEIVGRRARIVVATYAKRSYARVKDVLPLED